MLTEPVTAPDHREILAVVRQYADATFGIARVRLSASTPEGHDQVAWKHMASMGWAGIGLPSDVGGADLGASVQCILHRELAGHLAPSPFLASAAFGAASLCQLGELALTEKLLTDIAEGTMTTCLVWGRARGWDSSPPSVTATRSDDGWRLDGSCPSVLGAAQSDVLTVLGATGPETWGLFLVAANEDFVVGEAPTIDVTRSFSSVDFAGTRARLVSVPDLPDSRVLAAMDHLAVYLAAEMVGTGTAAVRRTLHYMRTREQFGKPIGSFQALKHRMADVAVALTIAQEFVFSAADLVDTSGYAALRLAAPLALARAGEVAKFATEEAIQLHGAVGFTDELEMGMYYKRILSDLQILATPAEAYARVAEIREGVQR